MSAASPELAPARAVAEEPARRSPGTAAWPIGGALLLVALAGAVVLVAGTRPGYDPYGWLEWGKLTVHGALDTNGAPSWKPLPFLFTVPYALFGHLSLWLWMVTAVAASLAGPVFAWRIAARLADPDGVAPAAARVAGAVAAVMLLGIRDYTHFILSAQSDTMIVSLCLGAIDCWLAGRLRWALALWLLAALGRPEVWPFLGLFAVSAWRTAPALRRAIAVALLLVPLLWFGIPALTAKSAFIAGDNALHSPRELHSDKVWGTLDRLFDLHELPVWLAAGAAVIWATLRRRRSAELLLAAGAVLWVVVEVAFVLHGYPGVPRYLFEPVAVVGVLAGVLLGRVWRALATSPRGHAGVAMATGLTLAFAAVLSPAAGSRIRIEQRDLRHERTRTDQLNRLHTLLTHLGAARITACGQPDVPIAYQSVYAWYTGAKIGTLYVNHRLQHLHPSPLVQITPLSMGGWRVHPVHITRSGEGRCRGLATAVRAWR